MAFPEYTRTGKNWEKRFLEMDLQEIEKEIRKNPVELSGENWVPMFRRLVDYVFHLEERITKLEDS